MSYSQPHELAQLQATVDRFAADLSMMHESVALATRFASEIDSVIKGYSSAFEKLLLRDRALTYLQQGTDSYSEVREGLKRHNDAHLLVSAALPGRGWYLSGREPCTLSLRLRVLFRKATGIKLIWK